MKPQPRDARKILRSLRALRSLLDDEVACSGAFAAVGYIDPESSRPERSPGAATAISSALASAVVVADFDLEGGLVKWYQRHLRFAASEEHLFEMDGSAAFK